MYNQSFDEKVTGSKRNEDYDLCNTEAGQKFVIKWSPQDGARYLSKNRYASPRSVSKSVPRRNRGTVRYNINRSLNFDVGSRSSDNFKSPNSSSDSSVSVDGDRYLSRSAKILRALNINYSPLRTTKPGSRKINKSLNFDLSPSPKRLGKFGKSPKKNSHGNHPSPLSKINKTLNFDTSSNESDINSSVVNSSPESIDENQNQTPSQRNRSAKKSLNYLSPNSVKSFGSINTNVRSPMLRSGLRDKVDNIVLNSMTPNVLSTKKIQMNNKVDYFGASTPRNLFNDYDDDDNDDDADDADEVEDDDDRPQTPKNVVRIIPESMSAIKKSHKKERLLGRIERLVPYDIDPCSESETFTDVALDIPREELRPTTPLITNDNYQSPLCALSSIKKSHKKDKSKKNLLTYQSEDEMSDTGSIFDYTEEPKTIPEIGSSSLKIPEIRNSDADEEEDIDYEEEKNCSARGRSKNEEKDSLSEATTSQTVIEDERVTDVRSLTNPDGSRYVDRSESGGESAESSCLRSDDNTAITPTVKSTNGDSVRPLTPENRINFLQRIMTDSIKKSHKKIKDINRKMLFKPRMMVNDVEGIINREHGDNDDAAITVDEDRAVTPENTNSSRLLLAQFSSVKKSHRKDKHRRMVSGSIRRKKCRTVDGPSNSDNEALNCSVSSSASDFPNLAGPTISPGKDKSRKTGSNDFSSDNSSSDGLYRTPEGSSLKNAGFEGVGELQNSEFSKSSGNKRKNLLNLSSTSGVSQSSSDLESISMEYESLEEELKIFTPIKKRKSLGIIAPAARRICETNDPFSGDGKSMDEPSTENNASRCSTPITARGKCVKLIDSSFKTPERNASGVFVTVTDYSSPVVSENENVDDPSGRSTPQNSSTAVLMADHNSIKKSHKKDKRGNISRRSLICPQNEHESGRTPCPEKPLSKRSTKFQEDPRPSTSYESASDRAIIDSENEANLQTKTPPNCLKAKTYLRLMQTSSIKRSHKKVREGKKFRSIDADPELSDDGSIFDEAEKSVAMENDPLKEGRDYKDNNHFQAVGSKLNFVATGQQEKNGNYHDDGAPSNYSGNLSDDGSIFDSEEKLESTYKSGNSGEHETDIA